MTRYDVTRYHDDTDGGCCRCRRRNSDLDSNAEERSKSRCSRWRPHVQFCLFLLGVAAGVGLGILLRTVPPFDDHKNNPRPMWYLRFPGEILARIMRMIYVPLLVSSLISGIGSLDVIAKIGLRTGVYYLSTTALACVQGFVFVFAIQPEANVTLPVVNTDTDHNYTTIDGILDLIRNVFPDNLVETTFRITETDVSWAIIDATNVTNATLIEDLSLKKVDSTNILGVTILSIIFGAAISNVGAKAKPLAAFFQAVYGAVMDVVGTMLWLYPLGIVFILAPMIVSLEDPLRHLQDMTWFLVTVTVGLSTHVFITLPIVYAIFVRKNPYTYMLRVLRALITALSTSNSQVTLPVTLDCLETDAQLDSRVTRFVCPVGATFNMDGLVIYEVVVVIFATTLRGLTPGVGQVFIVGFTTILLSLGAPTAGGRLTTFIILFRSIGLPVEDVFLFLPFDWLLGRLRMMTNVWSDCVGAAVVHKLSHQELARRRPAPEDNDSVRDYRDTAHTNGSYKPITESDPPRRKSYTLTVENENGDVVKVSKV